MLGVRTLFGETILVDSSFDNPNSSYWAEVVGVLTATILLYLLQLHIEHQQQLVTSFIRGNKGLVKCIIKYYDDDMTHVTPGVTEADIILPAIRFAQTFNYSLEWYRGHTERQTEDGQQWTTKEVANDTVDNLAGQA